MAEAGLLAPSSPAPADPPDITLEDVSEGFPFQYDGDSALWWEFIAPQDGFYSFDAVLSTVGGVQTETSPLAFLAIDPSSTGVVQQSFPTYYEGTSCQWVGVEMTAGGRLLINLIGAVSLSDFVTPVNLILRCNSLNSFEILDAGSTFTVLGSGTSTSTSIALPALQADDFLFVGVHSTATSPLEATVAELETDSWSYETLQAGTPMGCAVTYCDTVTSTPPTSLTIDYAGGTGYVAFVALRFDGPGYWTTFGARHPTVAVTGGGGQNIDVATPGSWRPDPIGPDDELRACGLQVVIQKSGVAITQEPGSLVGFGPNYVGANWTRQDGGVHPSFRAYTYVDSSYDAYRSYPTADATFAMNITGTRSAGYAVTLWEPPTESIDGYIAETNQNFSNIL